MGAPEGTRCQFADVKTYGIFSGNSSHYVVGRGLAPALRQQKIKAMPIGTVPPKDSIKSRSCSVKPSQATVRRTGTGFAKDGFTFIS